jgi:hypothetical protein
MKEEQQKIAQINANAQMMKQRANQFLMGDPEEQSSMMADAMNKMKMQEQGFANQEAALDSQVQMPEEVM